VQLTSVRVTNFRSILDSGEFSLKRVTCLVGKNESGKTAILHALNRLKPYDSPRVKYDRQLDYPRGLINSYASRHPEGEATVVHTTWTLDDEDVSAIEDSIGSGTIASRIVSISKAYEAESPKIEISLDYLKAKQHVLWGVKLTAKEQELAKGAKTTSELGDVLSKIQAPSEGAQAALARLKKYTNGTALGEAVAIVWDRMPSFLYFDNYDRMSGSVALNQLNYDKSHGELSANDRVFDAFLEFAGTSAKELGSLTTFEPLRAKVEGASNAITEQIFEYWSQNQFLQVQFVAELGLPNDPAPFNQGMVMRARIYNELHKATVRFDDRSAGFVWFFSFLVLFSQVKKSHGNVIILLDEPGLNLHGKAQGDLLRYFDEKLRPDHQVIYTTHSPFMVPHDDLLSVRTVEDVIEYKGRSRPISHGSKVGDKILSTDADTLFPLQGALGYEITQSLFIGANTLLVEGPADVLMLQAASEELRKRGRTPLDPRWALCPVGGIGKVSAFVSLFGANKLNVVVLTDYSKQDDQQVARVREILANGKVFTAEAFCGQSEADLEDFFGPVIYTAMVNGAYKLSAKYRLTADKAKSEADKSERILKRVEHLWAALPGSTPAFDHFAPASWLIQHPDVWELDPGETAASLGRFEALFNAVNVLVVTG
jgi:predicted ATPase